jgi:hypothetical protein
MSSGSDSSLSGVTYLQSPDGAHTGSQFDLYRRCPVTLNTFTQELFFGYRAKAFGKPRTRLDI